MNWFSQGQLWGRCKVRCRAEPCRRCVRPGRRRVDGGSWRLPRSPRVMRGPPSQVVGDASNGGRRRSGPRGGEAPRHSVPEGVLYLGVAAVVSLQFQGVSLPARQSPAHSQGGNRECAYRPPSQVDLIRMGDHLDGQPGGIGGEAAVPSAGGTRASCWDIGPMSCPRSYFARVSRIRRGIRHGVSLGELLRRLVLFGDGTWAVG